MEIDNGMEIENGNGVLWKPTKPTVYRKGETYKKYLPDYLQRIQKHYGSSSAPGNRLKELSPFDFHRKWISGCFKDKDWTSVIMKVAPSVVSVSIFIGVQRKIDCTGLIIGWDDPTRKATVLTCAKLLRIPEYEDRDNYYIVVRLPDGDILLAEEDYVDFCHNIITLKVTSDVKLKPVDLDLPSPEIEEGIEVVSLSRDFNSCSLLEGSGIIHVDYPYFGCEQLVSSTCYGSEVGEGGPLITRFGYVCGINFFDGYKSYHPLPISVISSCLKQWDTHNIVVQPWFGLTVINIAELPIDALETIAKFLDVTATAAVIKEVHEGSPADEAGVCPGDLIMELMAPKPVTISSVSEYSRRLRDAADFLSTSCTLETVDSPANIKVLVQKSASSDQKVVCAQNLSVDDRRFCCSWREEYAWFSNPEPLVGSQTDCAFDVGDCSHNLHLWFNDRHVSP